MDMAIPAGANPGEVVFRNPDMFQVLPLRDLLRTLLPKGTEGCVIEDLDLIIRHYGPKYQLDAKGRVMLIEHKFPTHYLGRAQENTFGLIHELMRLGDPKRKRYLGYYVLQFAFDENKLPIFPATVNRQYQMDKTEFVKWLNGITILPSLWD